jgi:hypothetical protein
VRAAARPAERRESTYAQVVQHVRDIRGVITDAPAWLRV